MNVNTIFVILALCCLAMLPKHVISQEYLGIFLCVVGVFVNAVCFKFVPKEVIKI
jgi:hypothetical protein